MWTVAPQIKTIEQPVQFLDRQHVSLVGVIGRYFETFGLKAFESKAKAVAFPIQNLHPIAGVVEKDEKHRIDHRHSISAARPSMDFRKPRGGG